MDKKLWGSLFLENEFPHFPCPRCQAGILRLDKKSYKRSYPQHVLNVAKHNRGWGGNDEYARFVGIMQCSRSDCGEVVSVAGKIEDHEVIDDDNQQIFQEALELRSIIPAPHVIEIPAKLNRKSRIRF